MSEQVNSKRIRGAWWPRLLVERFSI